MIILALDCSSPVVSVAVLGEGDGPARILFQENTPHARSDSAPLFRSITSAIAACGCPDALCVGLGPGSYNGIRASIASARAMATALGIPLYGVPSPLGTPGPDSGFLVVGDARGGHSWIAGVSGGILSEVPLLVPQDQLPGILASRADLPCLSASPMEGIVSEITTPDAAHLAMAALNAGSLYRCHGTPEPLYLKPPHITKPRTTQIHA